MQRGQTAQKEAASYTQKLCENTKTAKLNTHKLGNPRVRALYDTNRSLLHTGSVAESYLKFSPVCGLWPA